MARSNKDNIFALDLGTTKFCLASMSVDSSGAPLIESISVPSAGMKKGMVVHLQDAEKALTGLISLAENEMKVDVRKIVVGIAGSHLKGRSVSSRLTPINGSITDSFLLELRDEVEALSKDETKEILHIIPTEYFLDERPPTSNPVNLNGRNIRGEYYLIESDRSYAKDIIKLCNLVGLEVTSLKAEPYASASVIANDIERKEGVVVSDIGGGTTDGIVFKDSKVSKAFTINVGGQLMTNDLSIGLRVSLSEAEKIKHHFGLDPEASPIKIDTTLGQSQVVTSADVHRILSPRVAELGALIAKELSASELKEIRKLTLTGGGSQVKSISNFLSSSIQMESECRMPTVSSEKNPMESKTMSARYATVAGLLYLEYLSRIERGHGYNQSRTARYFSNFFTWLREIS